MIARIVLLLVWLAAAVSLAPSPAAACGEDNQEPCQRRVEVCDTDVDLGYPYCGFNNEYSCNYPSLQVEGWWNKVCKHRNRGAGLTCCTPVNYTDPYGSRLGSTAVTEGYYGTVNLNEAWILVPSQTSPDWCVGQSNSPNPVKTVEEWMGYGVYAARLMINANFWNPGINPHLNSCNQAQGLTVSNKTLVSPDSTVHGQPTSSLIFFTPEEVKATGRNAKIADNAWTAYQGKIQNAVSGFWLLRNGTFVQQPGAIDPDEKRPRAAVGLSADGNTLYPVVVNPGFDDSRRPGATTLHGLADYLKQLGATDALTLDGSGSAQLVYYDPQTTIRFATKPSDVNKCNVVDAVLNNGKCYRPVPVFLGIE